MSYTPTEWKNGDTITAEKLNKIEEGIEESGGVLIVTGTDDVEHTRIILNKTWQEIYDAAISGKQVIYQSDDGGISLTFLTQIFCYDGNNQHSVCFATQYDTNSADSYPSHYYGD